MIECGQYVSGRSADDVLVSWEGDGLVRVNVADAVTGAILADDIFTIEQATALARDNFWVAVPDECEHGHAWDSNCVYCAA